MHWIKRSFLLLFLLLPSAIFAETLVVSQAMKASTIAEIFIEREAVRVELDVEGDSEDRDEFRAIEPIDGKWKITALEILEEQRVN